MFNLVRYGFLLSFKILKKICVAYTHICETYTSISKCAKQNLPIQVINTYQFPDVKKYIANTVLLKKYVIGLRN